MLVDINDKVDKVTLPTDAEDPVVTEISSDNELLFAVYLYAKSSDLTQEELYDKAVVMEKYLEGKSGITKVDISPNPEYELLVSVDKTKLENY
jgi:multidrug efflux pump subunit AcrB